MSISKLPSGRWRAQCYDPGTGRNVSVSRILGPAFASFRTKAEAKRAREQAREQLAEQGGGRITVDAFRQRWLDDPLYRRPKASTMLHNQERTKLFAAAHGALAMDDVTDQVVAAWLVGGARNGQVPALRAMWNDAMSAKAGRLVKRNPWANLGLRRGPGNAEKQPPSPELVDEMIRHARELSGPYFAGWLTVAAYTGMRPAELDGLTWDCVDLARGLIRVRDQITAKTRETTAPKNSRARWAVITPPARAALLELPRTESPYVFVNLHGNHWTASSRAYHWKAVRAAAGWTGSLYLATRHFAGWYMINVLELPSEDVAIALGHTDGGDLVRRLYGHRDQALALDRVAAAYARAAGANVTPLRSIDGGAS